MAKRIPLSPAPLAALTIETWPIDKPVPYEKNARIISDEAIAKVAASLKAFGFRQPIVVDKDGVIIAGHTRLRAARYLGIKEVPVSVAADLTPEQVRAYRIADNRTNQETTWDDKILHEELAVIMEDCKESSDQLALVTGFDVAEVETILEITDDEPEVDEKPKTAKGRTKMMHACPKCGHTWHAGDPPPTPETKRVKRKNPFGKAQDD